MENQLVIKDITIDYDTIKKTELVPEFPKPLSITKWVVLSSCSFLIPAVYAFLNVHYKFLYIYGFLSVSTTICSVNHWRHAEDGIRRKIDRIVAGISFVIYVTTGIILFPIYLSVVTLGIITSSFIISNYLSQKHHPYWFLVHVFFHISVTITKIIIISYMLHFYSTF
jgi:hypothetical protein